MPQYDNNMSGVLFRNDRKESDKHPDYKGNCEINNVELWVSAWIKSTKKDPNKKFMSLSFELKDGQSFGSVPADVDVPIDTADFETTAVAGADDDIPF